MSGYSSSTANDGGGKGQIACRSPVSRVPSVTPCWHPIAPHPRCQWGALLFKVGFASNPSCIFNDTLIVLMSASTKKVRDVRGLHPESHRVRKELAEKWRKIKQWRSALTIVAYKTKLVWHCNNLFLGNRKVESVDLLHFTSNMFITIFLHFLKHFFYSTNFFVWKKK